jgi:D-amino-acid dehydrogenase
LKKKIVIIGAGTIGLHCAYFLNKNGHEVEIIEAASETDTSGCSYGNCGLIVPSHFVPLASPGMLKSGLKMIFDSKSPVSLSVFKNIRHIPWFLKFVKAANMEHVRRSTPALFSLNVESKKLYREIHSQYPENLEWQGKGLLMTCTTSKGFEEEIEISKIANDLGIGTKILDTGGLKDIEPDVKFNVSGAVWYECDAHIHPAKYLQWLKNELKRQGVQFHYQSRLINLKTQKGKIVKAETDTASFTADEFVLAAGIYSKELAKNIGFSLPLISGKGYSIDFPETHLKLNIPVILTEAKVALTPFVNSLRLGSGMEFNGKTGQINYQRVQEMLDRTHDALPDFPKYEAHKLKIWEGLRPVTPDGIPLIGRTSQIENLLIAAGHAMMGVSLAPVTGKIVSDLVEGKPDGRFSDIYRLNRF